MRQAGLKRRPMLAVVERKVQTVLDAEIQQSLSHRILADAVRVAVYALRQIAGNRLPRPAVVRRLVDERVTVVDLMQVDGHVCDAVVESRRLDIADGAPRGKAGQIRGDVCPARAGIARHLHLTVVRAGPDDALLDWRLGDREHDAGILDADVVRCESARGLLARHIAGREIGADHLPALAAVGRAMHVLASRIDGVVIVRCDRERERPVEAVLHTLGRYTDGDLGPDLYFARLPRPLIETLDGSAEAPEAGTRGPHDVRIDGIGNRPTALTARHRVPHPARTRPRFRLGRLLGEATVARSTRRWSVLPIAVNVVRHLVVGGHVIHLRDWQLNVMPALAAIDRKAQPIVVRDGHAFAVRRVDPHVVVVADRRDRAGQIDAGLTAVHGLGELRGDEERFVLVVRRYGEAGVVVRPAAQPAVGAHHRPVLAAVVAAPERSALRFLTVVGQHAVAGFDECIDAIRVAARNLRRNLPERRRRQAVWVAPGRRWRQPFPRRAAVNRLEESTTRAAAGAAPGMNLELPHAGKQHPRVVGIHRDVGTASILVDEERTGPRSTTVRGFVDAAILLRAVGVTQCAREHDVRVFRVDDDARDTGGSFQTHARPGFPGVERFVDAVADRDVAADECFAGTGPHRARIAGGHGERANRLDVLGVEHRLPVRAVIDRLPDAAGCRTGVIDVRTARHARYGDHAIADRSDVPEFQRAECVGRRTRRLGGDQDAAEPRQRKHEHRTGHDPTTHRAPPTRVL